MRPWAGPTRNALRGALALLACAMIPFARVLFARHVLYARDVHFARWGELESFAACIGQRSWPVWDTLSGFGRPMLANPVNQVLYPFTWLSLAFWPPDYYDLFAFAHVLLGGAGTLLLARRLGVSHQGSLLAGAVFLLSGPLLSTTNMCQHVAGAAWVPWVLAAGDAALARPGLRRTLLWGGAFAMQLLSGSVDFVAISTVAQAALCWRRLAARRDEHGKGPLRRIGVIAGAAGFAVALTAAQWLPTLELLSATGRAALDERERQFWSLHPVGLAQALVPLFPQDLPLDASVRSQLYSGREPLFHSLYLGAAVLPLLVAGALARPRRDRLLLAGLGAAAVAFSLGGRSPLYYWALEAVPLLKAFRYPVKGFVLAALAFALLAGLGLDAWPRASRRVRTVACAAGALAAVGLLALRSWLPGRATDWLATDLLGRSISEWLQPVLAPLLPAALLSLVVAAMLAASSGTRRPRLPALAAVLAVAELALAHRDVVQTLPASFFRPAPGVIAVARADGVSRWQVFDYWRRRAGNTGPTWKADDPPAFAALPSDLRFALETREYPRLAARWGIRSGFGYDAASLDFAAYSRLVFLLSSFQEEPAALARLLALGGVTHLASRHRAGLESFPLLAVVQTVALGEAYVQRVPRTLPRAYAVAGVRVAPADRYAVLLDPGFDPFAEVLLAAGQERRTNAGFAGDVRLLEDRPGRIIVEAQMAREGQLVVLESHAQGWRASVDGVPAVLQPANRLFLSLPLAPGSHRVELVYHAPGLRSGLVISASAALAALCLLLRVRSRR